MLREIREKRFLPQNYPFFKIPLPVTVISKGLQSA